MRKCVGLDWRRSPERILAVIAELDADIVALQEVDRRLGARPAAIPLESIERHTGLVPVKLAANDVSLGWHGNAILIRRGMDVAAFERLELPGLEPRGAVLVELVTEGSRIRVVGTHLGLLRPYRQRQMREIASVLDRRAPMPTVILGDFNEWSAGNGMVPFEKQFEVHAPGRSYHTAYPVAALDRIAVSHDITVVNAGVHRRGAALIASDHLPIWADITV